MKRIIIFFMMLAALMGCEKKGLELVVRYDRIQGLQAEDRVLFQNNQIGKVVRVAYVKDGRFDVSIVIAREFSAAATEYSRFVIVPDSADQSRKAIEMIQIRKGGRLLADGETVEGTSRASTMVEEFKDSMTKGFEDIQDGFRQLMEDLGRITETEEYKTLKNELDQLINDLKRSGHSAGDKIQKEILPRMQKELEELRKRLDEFNRKKEPVPPTDRQEGTQTL